jgi:Flp pilus assembly protein TadD
VQKGTEVNQSEEKERDGTVDCLRKQVQECPKSASAYQNLGSALAKLRRFDEAEAALKTSLSLEPNDLWTNLFIGNVYYESGRYLEALSSFTHAKQLAPNHSMPYVCLADTCAQLGDLETADKMYRLAVKVEPHCEIARRNLERWLRSDEVQDDGAGGQRSFGTELDGVSGRAFTPRPC